MAPVSNRVRFYEIFVRLLRKLEAKLTFKRNRIARLSAAPKDLSDSISFKRQFLASNEYLVADKYFTRV